MAARVTLWYRGSYALVEVYKKQDILNIKVKLLTDKLIKRNHKLSKKSLRSGMYDSPRCSGDR